MAVKINVVNVGIDKYQFTTDDRKMVAEYALGTGTMTLFGLETENDHVDMLERAQDLCQKIVERGYGVPHFAREHQPAGIDGE